MNNEAFRKLVREQVTTTTSTTSSNSTTREFARQAVQAEFRQKRKRRHKGKDDGDYSTDEDNDDNDDDARFSKKGKQHPFELQPTQVRRKKGESTMGPTQNEGNTKYRDRAKERREGKLPEEGNELLLLSSRSEEEDDENDQLLDAVLEAAEKGQIVQGPTDDDGTRDEDDGGNKPRLPNTEMEAREWILAASSSSSSSQTQLMPKTALGREMLSFLRSRYLQDQQQQQQQQTISSVTPAAGRAIQRSTLTFSLRAFPGDTQHAWEVPSERTYATEHPMLSSTTTCEKASPATKELLTKLLRNNSCLQRKLAAKEKEKWRVVEKPGKDSLKPQAKKAGNGQATTATASNDSDDDDDEDIFGGAGDYDLTEEAAVAGEDDKEQKESGNKEPVPRVRFSDSEHKDAQWSVVGWTQQGQDSSDADRMALPRLSKVSGYDEEVDMDFDGRLEEEDSDDDDDEEQQRKKAKRKKKGSAEADEDD